MEPKVHLRLWMTIKWNQSDSASDNYRVRTMNLTVGVYVYNWISHLKIRTKIKINTTYL